ncbi:MAG: nickel pincer cofactor biosynthesis protein LarB [Actinomycetota bacterium]|nr:nickel pincer cofactor biosynthesis protein LarB [Actinomycetota bacterium]
MRPEAVKDLLTAVQSGATTIDEAVSKLRAAPFEDLGFARVDTHRELRCGTPEAIYAESKTTDEVVAIANRLLESTTSPVLITRVPPDMASDLHAAFPDAIHHERARLFVLRADTSRFTGTAVIVAAGTSDLAIADEAAATAEALGVSIRRINDVGVAGPHRVLSEQGVLSDAAAIVVVAGMDGALPSLIGGIASAPIIAVPTSVGYGASFSGLAALLTMLNSCAPGVVVTNIDNGFGAGVVTARILGRSSQ